jgi:hypothetical protein
MSHTSREPTHLRRTLGGHASAWGRPRSSTQRLVFVREVELVTVHDEEAATTPMLDFELFVEVYSGVDVLWLSSSVFISSHTEYGWNEEWERIYSVDLRTKAGKVEGCVNTLSPLSLRQQAQHLPMSFLRDLMKDFPAGFLSCMTLPSAGDAYRCLCRYHHFRPHLSYHH